MIRNIIFLTGTTFYMEEEVEKLDDVGRPIDSLRFNKLEPVTLNTTKNYIGVNSIRNNVEKNLLYIAYYNDRLSEYSITIW